MARAFIANSNHASFGDTADFDSASSCTWAGWMKFIALSNDVRVWSKWGASSSDSAFIVNQNTGGKIGLALRSQETEALLYKETSSPCVAINRWTHIILEWTGGTSIAIYADAVSQPISSIVNNSVGTIRNAAIAEAVGKDPLNNNGALGIYDAFAAWKNVTLTQGEKAELAAGADPATIRPAALIALPTFERSGAIWDRKRGIVAALTGTLEAETGAPLRALDGANFDDDDEMAAAAPPASVKVPWHALHRRAA